MATRSMPDILRVQGPRSINVAGSLDDGPAVWEHCEFTAVAVKLKEKPVVAHLAESFQGARQLLEIELRCVPVGDLHGVSATKAGGVRAQFSFKPGKMAVAT